MKKIKLSLVALIAIVLAISTSAFTSVKVQTIDEETVYAFDQDDNLIGQGTIPALESGLCNGSGQFCAHVWTDKTNEDEPDGDQLDDMVKY
jgi:hypothetical protein